MTSRRKAKRAPRKHVWSRMYVLEDDGSRTPLVSIEPWYWATKYPIWKMNALTSVAPMHGCIKRSIQNKRGRGGSWNGYTVPWEYGAGIYAWNQNQE